MLRIKKKKKNFFRCVKLCKLSKQANMYVSKQACMYKYVCMFVTVTACARRGVTELVSERFPATRFHSLPAIATIIVSYVLF